MVLIKQRLYSRIFINILISLICLITSLLVLFLTSYNGYELLYTQPLLYLIVYLFILSDIIHYDKSRLFFTVFTAISGIRYVILPLLIVLTDHYGGRSIVEPNNNSFYQAILLMNYELIVVCVYLKILESKRRKIVIKNKYNSSEDKFSIRNNHLGYYLFGLFTIISMVLVPSTLSSINFVIPNSLNYTIEYGFIENLIIYCIIIFKQLIFVILVKKLYTKYKINKKSIYVFLSFMLSILNTVIYFGTNRSDIIISAIVSFLLLYKLYGKITIKYFVLGIIFLISVVIIVSGARNHVSVSRGESPLLDLTDTFQVYTGGIYNVAIAIETKQFFPEANNISVLFFDIFRPMIGISFLIRDLPFKYSNIFFNQRMWLHVDRRSQIIPMIGQGNLFFGFLFSPLFSIIIIRVYYYFEKTLYRTKNLEIYYFLSLVIVRLGFFMGQNTMNMINDMSMNLVLFFLIFTLNKFMTTTTQTTKNKHSRELL